MRRLGIAAVGLALVVGIVVGGVRFARLVKPAEAQAPPANLVGNQYCDWDGVGSPAEPGSYALRVAFSWQTGGSADETWLDLSLANNGFAPGTFLAKAVGPGYSYTQWAGIKQGAVHYWRVNLHYGAAWYASGTQSFLSATCPGGAPFGGAHIPPTLAEIREVLEGHPDDLEGRLEDLEAHLDRLEDATFGLFGAPSLGPSLDSRLDSLESELEALRSCVNDNIDALTSPGQVRLYYCN